MAQLNFNKQSRQSLLPLQTSDYDCNIAKSNKRLRGTGQNLETSAQKKNSAINRPPQFDPLCFIGRHGGSPLPPLKWADREEVWNLMCWKEQVYRRDPNLLQRQPQLTAKMRAVLFEWLSEVCEVYKLHRETFYLSMDFVDRYLSEEHDIPKSRLQLIGITSLFIAAKLEEIYPPPVKDFAYVTDRACTAEEILEFEILMLKTLHWALSPVTINHWCMIYLQVVANETNSHLPNKGIFDWRCREFLLPQFQRSNYVRLMQLVDLCCLDANVLGFPYSVVAAAAFFHMFQPKDWTLLVSGYTWNDLALCIQWMTPFAEVALGQDGNIKIFPDIPNDDMHNIQNHFVQMAFLQKVYQLNEQRRSYPPTPSSLNRHTDIYPTPPPSTERPPQKFQI